MKSGCQWVSGSGSNIYPAPTLCQEQGRTLGTQKGQKENKTMPISRGGWAEALRVHGVLFCFVFLDFLNLFFKI